MNHIYVQQDGKDFYIFNDESCDDLRQTVSAPLRVSDFDLSAALKARQWFEAFFWEAGVKIHWPNPFAAAPRKPVSSGTRMIDMSGYTGDDLEF